MSVTVYLKRGGPAKFPDCTAVESGWFPVPEGVEPTVPAIVVKGREGRVFGHFAVGEIVGYEVDDVRQISIITVHAPPADDVADVPMSVETARWVASLGEEDLRLLAEIEHTPEGYRKLRERFPDRFADDPVQGAPIEMQTESEGGE